MATFGRMTNMVRRPVRPNGNFHRERRRRDLNHPLALGATGLNLLGRLLLLPFELLKGPRRK